MMQLTPIHKSNEQYAADLINFLPTASFKQALKAYRTLVNDPKLDPWVEAQVAENDRYFLLTWVLRLGAQAPRIYHPWVYDKCREVEAEPDGCLDLWAREHWKSTIITFGGSIQEIIKSAGEITIGIFSHNTAHARDKFVNRIKHESQSNPHLNKLWPHIFWQNPKKEAPIWSRDGGLIFKRKGNPPESTVSGWGLVDGQPTGSHFGLMIYDDVVTEKAVTGPEMILKTTEMWELSTFMTQDQADGKLPRVQYIGTRYNYADTYAVMLSRDVAKPRINPATDSGTRDGKPVFLTQVQWDDKKKKTSTRTLACQMLQNPAAGDEQEFKPEWMRKYELRPKTLNVAILVDPANTKKKSSDNSAFAVIGIGAGFNKYLLDGVCHKMALAERWTTLKMLRSKWLRAPGVQVVKIGYEKYGMQADIEHFQEMMKIENKHFPIEKVAWPDNRAESAKDDRIRRLIPDHQNWRFFYPHEGDETAKQREAVEKGNGFLVARPIKRRDENGRIYNLVDKLYNNEYFFFPATTWKDMLDAMSRIYDLDIGPPLVVADKDVYPELHEND